MLNGEYDLHSIESRAMTSSNGWQQYGGNSKVIVHILHPHVRSEAYAMRIVMPRRTGDNKTVHTFLVGQENENGDGVFVLHTMATLLHRMDTFQRSYCKDKRLS